MMHFVRILGSEVCKIFCWLEKSTGKISDKIPVPFLNFDKRNRHSSNTVPAKRSVLQVTNLFGDTFT